MFSAANTIDADKDSYWSPDDGVTAASIEYDLGAPKTFNVALLQEQIHVGQRIEEFFLDAWIGSSWKEIVRSTTVGYKRLLRFPEVTAQKVRVRITKSRVCPTLSNFGLFRAPAISPAPKPPLKEPKENP
jgi:alpha-L-fucosidase